MVAMETAYVNIWNKRVGAIAWTTDRGLGTFEFEPSFFSSELNLAPLKITLAAARNRSFSFPELRNSLAFRGLPGLLADSLPDKYGSALINTWLVLKSRPSDSLNPVEMLCFIGKRGMGALEFEPAVPEGPDTSTKVEISSLVKIANEILSGREDFKANIIDNEENALLDILKIGTSAGGARAKAIIAFNPATGEVRSGQVKAPKGFTHWIIKFDGVTDSQFGATHGYGRVEMAYHLMARDAEIEMTECRLLEEEGRAHFMTLRFDREPCNGRIHRQSLCAMQHYDFTDITSYSYEQVFETMRMLGLPYPEAEQLFRRMVFNVIARNCEDHTKNFAFLMDKTGVWKLSPAFDVCHSYRSGSTWVSQQSLSVNGKRRDISREDFLSVARNMNIKKAGHIITQINEVVRNWQNYAEVTRVKPELRDAIHQTLINLNS
jgi:serine/threonine-protein kinase HipA